MWILINERKNSFKICVVAGLTTMHIVLCEMLQRDVSVWNNKSQRTNKKQLPIKQFV